MWKLPLHIHPFSPQSLLFIFSSLISHPLSFLNIQLFKITNHLPTCLICHFTRKAIRRWKEESDFCVEIWLKVWVGKRIVLLYYVLSSLKLCSYFSVNKLTVIFYLKIMNWFLSAFHSSYHTITANIGVHNDIVETADQSLFTWTVFTDLPKLSHTDAL